MKQLERGVILSRSPYSETSLIVSVLTEFHGLQTYLFQGAKKKKGMVLFPLALVEFTSYRRTDSTLGKMTELNLAENLSELPFDPVKSSIAFFIVELLQRTIKQGHAENELVQFIWKETQWLNHSNELTNYPLWFLAQYTKFCGITPAVEAHLPTVFDVDGGKLTTVRPIHPAYFEGEYLHWMEAMLLEEKVQFLAQNMGKEARNKCMEAWIAYYHQHLQGMHELKSLEVIRTILHA